MATTAFALPDSPHVHRAAVNRENAQHSTGPRTHEGKSRMRLNACKHGIYSKSVVLPGEDPAHFEALGREYHDLYQPRTSDEVHLVECLHVTQWRLTRLVALDLNLHTFAAAGCLEEIDDRFENLDEPGRYALAQAASFLAHSRMFDQLSRHEARLQKLYDRVRHSLDELLLQRQHVHVVHDPETLAAPVATPAAVSPSAPAAPNPDPTPRGFVPLILPDLMPHFTGPMADIKRKQWIRRQQARQPNREAAARAS